MSEVDKIRLSAEGAIERSRERRRPIGTKSVALRRQHLYKKLGRVLIAGGVVLLGAALFGALIQPLGFTGLLALFVLLIGVAVLFGRTPFPEPRQADLPKTDLKQLAGRTEIWLEAQRPRLPAPAVNLVDRIGQRLETLSPQLAAVDNDTVEAMEVRRLIGEQLPAFLRDYERVPEPLRRVERNGRTPDAQLVDGLAQSEFLLDPRAMPFVTAVQADEDVGAGLGPDVGGTALRAAVEAVLQLAGRGIDGHGIGRFHFIADHLRQLRGVQREAAGQGRDVLRRTGPIQRRRRQGRRRRGRGSGQRRWAVSGIGHVGCASCCYRPSALALSAS